MSLAEYYSQIRDPSQRRKDLGELAQALSFSDRYMVAQLVNRNARLDIFGRLPVEISEKVLQYLPLYQCFQARRVSRRWNALLCVRHAIQKRLAQETDSEELKSDDHLIRRAATIDAFYRAYPFSMKQILMKEPKCTIECYANGYLVYQASTSPASREILVLDIITGSIQRIATPNREAVCCVEMSPTMLFAATEIGKCYIWDVLDNISQTAPRCLQLERLDSMSVAVSRSSLALYTKDLDSQSLKIITWDRDSERTYQFSIPYSFRYSRIANLQLTSDGRSMLLLGAGRGSYEDGTLTTYRSPYTLYRMSLSGKILSLGEEIPVDDLSILESSTIRIECRSSTVLELFFQTQDQPWKVTWLYYSRYQDRLQMKTMYVDTGLVRDWDFASCFVYGTILYLRYSTSPDYREHTLQVIDLQDGKVLLKSAINTPLQQHQWQKINEEYTKMGVSSIDGYKYFFGDERFLVYGAEESHLNVLCFDPKVEMIDEDLTYRELRQEQLKADITKQRERFGRET